MAEYSDGLVLTWQVAAAEAGAAGHATIKCGHFWVALCRLSDLSADDLRGDADRTQVRRQLEAMSQEIEEVRLAFAQARADCRQLRRRVRAALGREGGGSSGGVMHRSPEARRLFSRAEELAGRAAARVVRPLHLLQAICEVEDPAIAAAFEEAAVPRSRMKSAADAAGAPPPAPSPAGGAAGTSGRPKPVDGQPGGGRTPTLDAYGRDLTQLAREGKLLPVIDRDAEIRRLAQVLLQQRRSNAILVGDAGVGKTCVVEGLAQRMARSDAAEHFRRKRIVEISLSAVLAGTKYRGEFEARLRCLLAEAAGAPDVILFLDEIHTLIGAGAAGGGSMDAADIMKPALARGEVAVIGATTVSEYRRHVERDPALQRRFQVIWVDEPTRDESIAILRGLAPTLQDHHGLSIGDEAVVAAVELSMRYAIDQRLPDKAVDLIDEACARARMRTFSSLSCPTAITRADIAQVVADRYRLPLDQLTADESARLLGLEKALAARIKGQPEALAAVSEVVRAARTGLAPPNRPKGVLLFLGPTGTGKTELAKALAEFLCGAEERLIRIDMSEYTERHAVSKLIGAPPGYVGYEEEGQLTAAVRTYPYSVILLDEIEKAHREVHEVLLQMLDEGRLTDAHGRRASFTEAVIIMTSNLGSSAVGHRPVLGLRAATDGGRQAPADRQRFREQMLAAARTALAPELLNRVQQVVLFDPLDRRAVREIIDAILDGVQSRLRGHSLSLVLDESAYDLLMVEGFDETFGARAMERTVARLITAPISSHLLAGRFAPGSAIQACAENGRIVFRD